MDNRHFIYLIPAALLMLGGCAKDDVSAVQEARRLSISVTDGGYAPASGAVLDGAPATRTVENGYATAFTAGDACGLYMVRGAQVVYDNLKLTAYADAAGSGLLWGTGTGAVIDAGQSDELYYLYYPYQKDMSGKTASLTGVAMTDAEFFKPLIDGWQPADDQSTHAAYTASDLMTATGTASTGTGGSLRLTFSMAHRMALAVLDMPETVYKFTDSRVPDYTSFSRATFSTSVKSLNMYDGTYRHLVNPGSASAPTIIGVYAGGTKEFTVTPSGLAAGSYKTYKVAGGTAAEIGYTVQRGDYLLRNGNLLPVGTVLTEEDKADVSAVVFWTPAETDPSGRTTPASLSDDKIMATDCPDCTHGLAVAVKAVTYDGSEMIMWQYPYEPVSRFQSGENFAPANKSDYKSIATDEASADINLILGYQNTKILKAYNDWCKSSGGEIALQVVRPVEALESFASVCPAPSGSTGWYIPSEKELLMLFHKDIDGIWRNAAGVWGGGHALDTAVPVFGSIASAGGDAALEDATVFYHSSSETSNSNSYYLRIYNTWTMTNVGHGVKSNTRHARAVCAF